MCNKKYIKKSIYTNMHYWRLYFPYMNQYICKYNNVGMSKNRIYQQIRSINHDMTQYNNYRANSHCVMKIALKASNGQFVCAEDGGGREVVANRNALGGYETFTLIPLSMDQTIYALRTLNGQYVCAEGGGGREVVANRNAIGPYETFTFIFLGNNKVALKASNGQYVCAEGGGGREVVANRGDLGPWETFDLLILDIAGNI